MCTYVVCGDDDDDDDVDLVKMYTDTTQGALKYERGEKKKEETSSD
jgi:hypothetical protein